MSFVFHRPPAALQPFVAFAHGYRVGASPAGLHRGLPSRHLTLVFELAAPLRVSGLGAPVAAHAVVGGLHTGPALIDASVPQEGVQYALEPLAAGALLGVPAAALCRLAVDLGDVFGPGADRIVAQLVEARSWDARFAIVDSALLARLAARPADERPEVGEAWRVLFSGAEAPSVADLAEHVGWSRRHLSERFRSATGITPKQAARIARFEATRRLLVAGRCRSLAEVAAVGGYADQAHLSREWRALAGCSVTTWLQEEFPFVQAGSASGRE